MFLFSYEIGYQFVLEYLIVSKCNQFRKISHVFACTGCHSLHLQPLLKKMTNGNSIKYTPKTFDVSLLDRDGKCVHCKQSVHMAGPIYSAPIHNHQFVIKLLER